MTASLTPEEFDDIVAAYALDAVEPHEASKVEAYIASRPDAMADVDRLRAAAVWYGATDSLTPPPRLRATVVGRLRAARIAVAAASPAVATHVEACDYLREALARVTPGHLDDVTPNGLTVRELAAHLAGMESQVTDSIDSERFAAITEVDNDERTRSILDATREWDFDDIVAEWENATAATRRAANERDTMRWFHNQVASDVVTTFRSFETWVHAGDIDVAMGRDRRMLSDIAFATMAELSMTLIPGCLQICGTTRPGATAKFVLTGPGAGEFVIALAPGGDTSTEPCVTIVAPVHEWCMRIADRIDVDDFPMTVTGDAAVAADVVAAANSLAML